MCSDANKTRLRRGAGVVLVVAGLVGAGYAFRAGRSQYLYHKVKFGSGAQLGSVQRFADAETAYRLYPHSYHLSYWMAEQAWYEEGDREAAGLWVSRGLRQNPYHLELHWLETILVGEQDPARAAEVWETYSDAVFWNSWVLAGRVYWYALAGRFDEAERFLGLLQGRPDYGWASEALAAARYGAE